MSCFVSSFEILGFQRNILLFRTDVRFLQPLTIKVRGFCVGNRYEPAAFIFRAEVSWEMGSLCKSWGKLIHRYQEH
jgi:hypothetical protein